ncbi:AraC family transcriptional regulator [Rhodococcus oxybenzonivorans]|uniref:AraC family transcriptional regulator n=1 Tax=Rhodococcus TaxID=1827 RepID=UPI0013203AC0|nr:MULTISPECIES: AraC family transcriptional regulator [Rhodococcus]MDV7354640.1 AraC family transcriptional regulator [Rhodococcus oxybenzonivorans]QHE70905.1 Transcriptional regulator, AraC family [Rhodococcus sp. WAY2]
MTMLVRNAALTGYLDLVRARKVDPLPLLRSVGLQAADLAVPNQWIAIDAAAQLLERSAVATGLEDFGIRLADSRKMTNLGPISVAAQGEPDLRGVLMLLGNYQHIRSEAISIRISEADDLAKVRIDFDLSPAVNSTHFSEMTVCALIRLIKFVVGNQWNPAYICFTHDAPATRIRHPKTLGKSIQFGDKFNGFVFLASDLDLPNRLFDTLFQSFAKEYIDTIASPRPVDDLDRVRELIETTLPTGRCSLQHVAKTLGVNRVTVYRLLTRSNTSFSAMVNSIRADLAQRYVTQHTRSLTDIAGLLGFSELSAFSRWFRSEFGSSPTVWRAERGNEARSKASENSTSTRVTSTSSVTASAPGVHVDHPDHVYVDSQAGGGERDRAGGSGCPRCGPRPPSGERHRGDSA